MSEVKRYRFVDANGYPATRVLDNVNGARYVAEQCFDAIQAQLAALREELAKFDEGMRALACSLGAGGYNAETLTADQLVGKVQWGIDHLLDVHEKRLTAAEQRNAELVELLRKAKLAVDDVAENCEDQTDWATANSMHALSERIDAALKPTESGASE